MMRTSRVGTGKSAEVGAEHTEGGGSLGVSQGAERQRVPRQTKFASTMARDRSLQNSK